MALPYIYNRKKSNDFADQIKTIQITSSMTDVNY